MPPCRGDPFALEREAVPPRRSNPNQSVRRSIAAADFSGQGQLPLPDLCQSTMWTAGAQTGTSQIARRATQCDELLGASESLRFGGSASSGEGRPVCRLSLLA
jgi:hypothetical protein